MANNDPFQVGAKNQGRFPTTLDYGDPEGVADFLLGLGYDQDNVVNTLTKRCSLDRITARRIVVDVANQLTGGQA